MSLRRVSVSDLFTLTKREVTPEGYLVAPANISSAGNVQDYRARELSLDGDPDRIVSLYRPAEEVFSPETIKSFESKPVTSNHPPEEVTSENWDEYSVGDVRDIAAGGAFTTGRVIVRDKAAVDEVLEGKTQMSCGYSFDLDMTPGTSPSGKPYHGVQRNIRGNHLAIVDSARGGPGCRISDSKRKETTMTMQRVKIGDFSFDVDATIGPSVQDAADRHHKALMDCMSAHDAVKAERDGFKAKLQEHELKAKADKEDAEKKAGDSAAKIEKLEAQVVQIPALVEERTKLVVDARAIMGEDFEIKGKTNAAIRAEVLADIVAQDSIRATVAKAALGGVEPSKASEEKARVAFDTAIAVEDATASDGEPSELAIAAVDGGASRKKNAGGERKLVGRELHIHRMTTGYYADPKNRKTA